MLLEGCCRSRDLQTGTVLGPPARTFRHPGIKKPRRQLFWETLFHLFKEIPGLVLSRALYLGKGGDVIQVPMVEAIGQLSQVPLQIPEIIDHIPFSKGWGLKNHLDHVPVAVEAGALPFIVPKEVG